MYQDIDKIIKEISEIGKNASGIYRMYSINSYWFSPHGFRYQLLKMEERRSYQHETMYRYTIEGDFSDLEILHSYLITHKKQLIQNIKIED